MTLIEAINKIDELKPNAYTQEEKVKWLSTLDGIVKHNIIDTHEGAEEVEFNGYDADTPLDTVLLVPEPYDDMYLNWMEAKIDYYNAEYIRYNNSITRYNDVFTDYANHYNRTHKPKGTSIKYY